MIFNLQDSICTLRKDVARIRQKRVNASDAQKGTPMGCLFVHQRNVTAHVSYAFTGRSLILPIPNGKISETRPTGTYERRELVTWAERSG